MKQRFTKYTASFLLTKVLEFVSCTFLATALIISAPGAFYADVGVAGALRGGLIFSGMFFLLTLYPVFSFIVFCLTVMKVSSVKGIAGISAVFMLGYSAFFALSASDPFPLSFWIAWLCMGASTFLITVFVIQKRVG